MSDNTMKQEAVSRWIIVLVIFVWGTTTGCHSPEKRFKNVNLYGGGNSTCSEWTARRRERVGWHDLSEWVLGWVSAANSYEKANLRAVSPDTLDSWVDKYCAQHPLDNLRTTAETLVSELKRPLPGPAPQTSPKTD